MPSMIPCPKCTEYSFHKSHTKNLYEKTRKKLFRQQPYRCHKCGHRGWVARSILKPKPSAKQILIYVGVFILAIIFSIILKKFLS
jgi:predicted nucleic-acid-binding Zn-ribbon protein